MPDINLFDLLYSLPLVKGVKKQSVASGEEAIGMGHRLHIPRRGYEPKGGCRGDSPPCFAGKKRKFEMKMRQIGHHVASFKGSDQVL